MKKSRAGKEEMEKQGNMKNEWPRVSCCTKTPVQYKTRGCMTQMGEKCRERDEAQDRHECATPLQQAELNAVCSVPHNLSLGKTLD